MMKHGICFLIVLCGLILLPGLGRQVMEREQELRVVLTAHDMVETGRWMVPHYQNQLRLKKPPLMYWVVAAAFKMSGTVQSPFAARLPNVILTTLLFGAIYWASRTLLRDSRAAPLAVLLASASFIVQRYARLAETDIAQALFVTLACTAVFKALTGDKPARWWLLAGLFSGTGFMFKGPASLVMPLLAAVALMLSRRLFRRPSGMKWKALLLFLPAFALIALPWYAALEIMPATDDLADNAVESELQALIEHDGTGHPAPFHYYVLRAPVSMFPWGLLIFPAAWLFWRNRREGDGIVFLFGWLLSSLILLSLLYNKQQHYMLLLLPASAIMTAALLLPWIDREGGRLVRFIEGYFALLLLVVALLAAAGLSAAFFMDQLPLLTMLAAGAVLALLAAAGWRLFRGNRRTGVLIVVWAAMQVTVCLYIFVLHPVHRPETVIPEFAREADRLLATDQPVYLVGRKRGTFEFYANRHTRFRRGVAADEVWAQMPPGAALVSIRKPKKHAATDEIKIPPALEYHRGRICCRLFVKPAAVDQSSASSL